MADQIVNGEKSIRGLYGEKASKGSSKKYDMKTSKIKVLRREFFNIVLSDRYHADRAPASFMNAISRFRVTFFGYFNLHEDGVIIEEGDNGEERGNDRRDEETEEQKATREYYERSVELERLRCK